MTEKPTRVHGRCGRRETRSGHRGTMDGADIGADVGADVGADIVAGEAMFPSLPWGVVLGPRVYNYRTAPGSRRTH